MILTLPYNYFCVLFLSILEANGSFSFQVFSRHPDEPLRPQATVRSYFFSCTREHASQ